MPGLGGGSAGSGGSCPLATRSAVVWLDTGATTAGPCAGAMTRRAVGVFGEAGVFAETCAAGGGEAATSAALAPAFSLVGRRSRWWWRGPRGLRRRSGGGIGANAAAWSALIRSVISPAVIWFQAVVFGAGGLRRHGGQIRIRRHWLPGGGGRCSAILPPMPSCHHASGPDLW